MKDRASVTKELQNLKHKDNSILLIYGTYGISKDLSKMLKEDERILCYASACVVKGIHLYKNSGLMRTYLVCTDKRVIYIEHGRANIVGVFIPAKQTIISLMSVQSVNIENIDNVIMQIFYAKKMSIVTQKGKTHEYYIMDAKAAFNMKRIIETTANIYTENFVDRPSTPSEVRKINNISKNVCLYCGTVLPKGGKFCPKCGKRVNIEKKGPYSNGAMVKRKKTGHKNNKKIIVGIIIIILLILLVRACRNEDVDSNTEINNAGSTDTGTSNFSTSRIGYFSNGYWGINLKNIDNSTKTVIYDGYEYAYSPTDPSIIDATGYILDDNTLELQGITVNWDGDTFFLENGTDAMFMSSGAGGTHDYDNGSGTYSRTIPPNPNEGDVVGEAIQEKIGDAANSALDGAVNGMVDLFMGLSDDNVDKTYVSMYYGTWYDQNTGYYIYISEGTNGNDYSIDLSALGYGSNIAGTFTASQTIYMRDIDRGIIMNEDGSIYVDKVSMTTDENYDGGNYIKQ